ncbi:MAG: hypothetical protein K0R26_12 [Bacteroidota bacterium]|jgi:hypothetical protein|nr:hypothetical protein [Bacteroidota bacterium]
MKKTPKGKVSKLNLAHMKKHESINFIRSVTKVHTNETLKKMGIIPPNK